MTGAAVKVTGVPTHEGFAEQFIEMLTGRYGGNVIVIGLDMAGLPVAHTISDVRWHATTSPEVGTNTKVGLFVPTIMPFTSHWYTGFVPPFVAVAV